MDDDEKEKDETEDNKSKDEVLYIPDVGFSVKIVSPGAEPFDIQVSSKRPLLMTVINFLLPHHLVGIKFLAWFKHYQYLETRNIHTIFKYFRLEMSNRVVDIRKTQILLLIKLTLSVKLFNLFPFILIILKTFVTFFSRLRMYAALSVNETF